MYRKIQQTSKEIGMTTEAVLDIKQWGNNLGVRLPVAVSRAAHLHVDQRVRITVENGAVVIRPAEEPALTLEQRLALFDPEKHGGEAMRPSQDLGAEQW
jgi:antitoxin MazE